jgi:predicted nucleic acid-binding protein
VALHTLLEVRRGLRRGDPQQARIRFLKDVGLHARILPFERQAAVLAGEMAAVLDELGQPIPVSDLCIASSSLIWGDGEIVTHDLRHFAKLRRFGLRVRMA